MNLLLEDLGFFDLTTDGLEIENKDGTMRFFAKSDIVICGISEVCKIFDNLKIDYHARKQDGDFVKSQEVIIECFSSAANLHKAWKISQNILEYQSAIATYTSDLIKVAKEINPNIVIATTRKNFPGSKESMVKAVHAGGGAIHRLGLYDSILVFKEHLEFVDDLESAFKKLKQKYIEKKITVEVSSIEEAATFAYFGADILQCEKMSFEELAACISLKQSFPNLLISATGGINLTNIKDYAKTGVDFIVTSSPYHAKPIDIKVVMERVWTS